MKKIFFVLISLFLITGCSVNYNVIINEDLSITERINIKENDDFYSTYYKTTRNNVLSGIIDNYKDLLEENNYKYTLNKGVNPTVTIERKYDNIDSFLNNSKFFNDYFDEIKYNVNGNIVTIETIGFNPNEEDNPDRFNVLELDVSITSVYNIINNNASSIDESTNTYHFIMNGDTTDFKILLEFDKSSKFNPFMKKLIMIIIAILMIIITWISLFVYSKKKKK